MPFIPFPNVPHSPGVPAIPRLPGVTVESIVRSGVGIIQGALWQVFQARNQWGIFDSEGNPLSDPRLFGGLLASIGGPEVSTGALDYSKETRVSDFPVERGGFASYNKVELAACPVVTLCMMGSESDRTAFLAAVDTACKSNELYSVATPEVTYRNYAIERYGYQRRSNKGATLLLVDLTLKEVREVSAQYTTAQIDEPKDAGSTPVVDTGKVQAKAPDQSTLKVLSKKIPSLSDIIQGMSR